MTRPNQPHQHAAVFVIEFERDCRADQDGKRDKRADAKA